jgi:hypothetical protein
MEWQRLKTPILSAKWHVLETTGKHLQITNDLGYAPLMHKNTRECGYAIPIGPRHILTLTAALKRKIAVVKGGCWWPAIEYFRLSDEQHLQLLETIADCAWRFVIGPDEATMKKYLKPYGPPPAVVEPAQLGFFQSAKARRYETTYFEVLTKLAADPRSRLSSIWVDFRSDDGPGLIA